MDGAVQVEADLAGSDGGVGGVIGSGGWSDVGGGDEGGVMEVSLFLHLSFQGGVPVVFYRVICPANSEHRSC